jgi:hypothetical protein
MANCIPKDINDLAQEVAPLGPDDENEEQVRRQ